MKVIFCNHSLFSDMAGAGGRVPYPAQTPWTRLGAAYMQSVDCHSHLCLPESVCVVFKQSEVPVFPLAPGLIFLKNSHSYKFHKNMNFVKCFPSVHGLYDLL